MALRSLVSRKTTLGLASSGFKLQFRGSQAFSLPDLRYDYGALGPAISGEIMQLHHQKPHQTYITNYNMGPKPLHRAMEKGDSSAVVKLQSAMKFNGGGLVNHSIFWKNLAPAHEGGGEPPHGSLNVLIRKMSTEGAAIQGSGRVGLETAANQDPLVTAGPLVHVLRPLSPHLPVYSPQLTSTFSIFNRISGAFLSAIVLFFYLIYLKMGLICFTYEYFYQFFFYASKLIPTSIDIFAASALAYHVYMGVRHLKVKG